MPKFCKECGSKFTKQAPKFCEECGHKVEQSVPPPVASSSASNGNVPAWKLRMENQKKAAHTRNPSVPPPLPTSSNTRKAPPPANNAVPAWKQKMQQQANANSTSSSNVPAWKQKLAAQAKSNSSAPPPRPEQRKQPPPVSSGKTEVPAWKLRMEQNSKANKSVPPPRPEPKKQPPPVSYSNNKSEVPAWKLKLEQNARANAIAKPPPVRSKEHDAPTTRQNRAESKSRSKSVMPAKSSGFMSKFSRKKCVVSDCSEPAAAGFNTKGYCVKHKQEAVVAERKVPPPRAAQESPPKKSAMKEVIKPPPAHKTQKTSSSSALMAAFTKETTPSGPRVLTPQDLARGLLPREGSIFLEGDFKKKSKGGMLGMSTWDIKYYVLQGKALHEFASQDDAKNPSSLQSMSLAFDKVTGLVDYGNQKPCRLDIKIGADTLALRGVNRAQAHQWYAKLKTLIPANVYTLDYS